MAKKKKHVLTKQELREDDIITKFFKRFWRKLKQVWKPVAVGALVLAIVVVAFFTWKYVKRKANLKASRAYATALTNFQRPLADPESSKPGELIDGKKPVKSMEELYTTSYGALSNALDACSSSRACGLIKLVRGKVALESARINEKQRATYIKKAISDFEGASKLKGFASALALESLGITYEENSAYDKALAIFHKLSVEHKDTFGGQALIHKARILELQGKTEDAKRLYKEVVKLNPQGRLAIMERKLKQEIQMISLFAKNPSLMKDKRRLEQLQMRYFRTMQSLRSLKDAASVYDPSYYAQKRLAFLDLGLTLESKQIKPADDAAGSSAPADAPAAKPAAKPAKAAPAAKPVAPAAKPAAMPAALPAMPAAKPAAKPMVMAMPAPKTAKPAVKPVAKPMVKPMVKAMAKPAMPK